jgi:hypothetical protein
MPDYRQQFPRLISMPEWLALAHADVPPLPWIADNGAEVCSFTVLALDAGILVVLCDAHGREVVRTGTELEYRAIEATAIALGGKVGELVFLPVAAR